MIVYLLTIQNMDIILLIFSPRFDLREPVQTCQVEHIAGSHSKIIIKNRIVGIISLKLLRRHKKCIE